ncbi:MAG: hypothetical protein A2045_02455 [Rhodocyclales bacterium GWA2_65_20]|nr:MAG: hypothetical protein A2045_02455 [Rhodocyclales bacterium GWA2_65_20]
MLYRLLADAVLLLHLAFILFVVLGAFLVWRRPRLAWLHLPAVAWGMFIEITGGICPLTPLENRLRHSGGEAGYDGSFIEHYLLPLIYPEGYTQRMQVLLVWGVAIVNLAAYAWACLRARKKPPAVKP